MASHPAADVENRFRLLSAGQRPVQNRQFELVATALLRRQRLHITYQARSRNEPSEREVSPQVVVHYKGNWYLVAWCHLRKGLRSFALDAMAHAEPVNKAAKEAGAVGEVAVHAGAGALGGTRDLASEAGNQLAAGWQDGDATAFHGPEGADVGRAAAWGARGSAGTGPIEGEAQG